jgi:hypothetical protein
MSTAIPKTFEPLEIYANGERSLTPEANGHGKYVKINELIDRAEQKTGQLISGHADIVEVGTWMGANAIEMAADASWHKIYCVDTWLGGLHTNGCVVEVLGRKAVFQQFCRNVQPWLMRQIIPCIGHSLTYAEIWPFSVTAVFIDAEHTYESCKADLNAWWPHVMQGGVIIGHDYESFPGVKQAADEFGFHDREGELFWRWKT